MPPPSNATAVGITAGLISGTPTVPTAIAPTEEVAITNINAIAFLTFSSPPTVETQTNLDALAILVPVVKLLKTNANTTVARPH